MNYHQKLYDQIRSNPEKAVLSIKPANLYVHAWQLSKSANLEQFIDYDLIFLLTDIYSDQEALKHINSEASNLISSLSVYSAAVNDLLQALDHNQSNEKFVEKTHKWKQGWVGVFQDMTYYEKALSKKYTLALERIDENQLN